MEWEVQTLLPSYENMQYSNTYHDTTKPQTVKTIDNVLAIHNDFLETCLKDCLLTTPELLRSLAKLQAICVNFSNAMLRLIPSPNISVATQAEQNMKMHSQENFEDIIKNFDDNFTLLTIQLLMNVSGETGKSVYILSIILNHGL